MCKSQIAQIEGTETNSWETRGQKPHWLFSLDKHKAAPHVQNRGQQKPTGVLKFENKPHRLIFQLVINKEHQED